MKNLFSLLIVAAIALFSFGCAGDGAAGGGAVSGTPGISGTIANAANMQVFFDKTALSNSNQILGKADMDANGNFNIPVDGNFEAGIYRLRVGAKNIAFPLNGAEKGLAINADLNSLSAFEGTINGSADAQEFISTMSNFIKSKDLPGTIAKIKSSANIMSATMLASTLLRGDASHIPIHNDLVKKLEAKYPGTGYTNDYKKFVNQISQQIAAKNAKEKIKIGQPAPDIKLPSPDGKEYALSDLKGKIVLIDFWASWCGPCRRANPHVVETYKKYKGQGFTVFSVSLDGMDSRTKARFKSPEQIDQQMKNQKKRWVDAIKKDNLLWDYHVSDLKKWESFPAREYGVSSIPKTFLIDREGKIAAVNPRSDLEQQLKKLL